MLQQTSEVRCKVMLHLIADMELMARAEYLVGAPPRPPQSPKDMHRLCCDPLLTCSRAGHDTASGACIACLLRCSLQQPRCGTADVATARRVHLSLLTDGPRMLQHLRMLLCMRAASLEYNVPHIVQVMRFALRKKDRRTFVDASEKHRDWCGTSYSISRDWRWFQGAEGAPLFA